MTAAGRDCSPHFRRQRAGRRRAASSSPASCSFISEKDRGKACWVGPREREGARRAPRASSSPLFLLFFVIKIQFSQKLSLLSLCTSFKNCRNPLLLPLCGGGSAHCPTLWRRWRSKHTWSSRETQRPSEAANSHVSPPVSALFGSLIALTGDSTHVFEDGSRASRFSARSFSAGADRTRANLIHI
jgi:hypothetical protein